MKRVLVVAGHPDDETLGAGGAMAKHAAEGDHVTAVILATGIGARKNAGEDYSDEIRQLRRESKRAMVRLGVNDIEHFDFPDNSMDSVPLLQVIKAVENVVKAKSPDIVYTHHWGDLNVDHRIAFNAVMTACRPFSCNVKRILCFEILSSTECNVQTAQTAFLPNFHVELTRRELDKKLSALKEYKTEMMKPPHPRSLGSVELLARYRGMAINRQFAESFFIARDIQTAE